MSVPGWVYKRMAMGDISSEEVEQLEKLASTLSKKASLRGTLLGSGVGAGFGALGAGEDDRARGALAGGIVGGIGGNIMSRGIRDGKAFNKIISDQVGTPLDEADRARKAQEAIEAAAQDPAQRALIARAVGLPIGGGLLATGGAAGAGRLSRKREEQEKQAKMTLSKEQLSKAIPASPAMKKHFKNRPAGAKYLSVKGRLYKFAQAASPTAVAGAKAAVQDPSDNLHKVMKAVPKEDRSGVLRVLRQMKESKKEASGCSSHAKPKKKAEKGLSKKAGQALGTWGQAGMLLGGAALAPVVAQLASKGIDSFSKKSPSQIRQDLQRILEVHPEIGRPEDPRVQMAYSSLVKLNPEYAEDPLIAGPLLKQIVDSRMDPTNPMSNPIVDPGIAKGLSEARKAVREGKPRNTFGDAMGTSLGQGVQMATLGGLSQPGIPEGSVAPGGYLV